MACDLPCISYMALYLVSMHVIQTNSRTSTHWKLTDGRVVQAIDNNQHMAAADRSLYDDMDDQLLGILTNKVVLNGGWKLEGDTTALCTSSRHQPCEILPSSSQQQGSLSSTTTESNSKTLTANTSPPNAAKAEAIKGVSISKDQMATSAGKNKPSNLNQQKITTLKNKKDALDCGKPVNSTPFDHLRGITNRKDHPHIPEPEVAMIFRKKGSRNSEIDMTELEKKLHKNKKERPMSALVFNQVGNFWRIKGNTQLSIECFRKALSISPNNPDVLLNLARVLFNLQYLDDAIYLPRRSLEMQPPDQNPWLQHFTLGEILKAYGHYQEASHHFRHTLELKSGFQPAQAHLREMEINPDGTVTYYTVFIILFLVMVVLCGILTTVEANIEEYGEMMKTQRHFNRAMAMRSIKLGMNSSRLLRVKKYQHS